MPTSIKTECLRRKVNTYPKCSTCVHDMDPDKHPNNTDCPDFYPLLKIQDIEIIEYDGFLNKRTL